ncbi:hypothetical protein [Nitratiruptor sp. SB155-2]|uniref:hypothetical protein n=1 Tax=Nitratiruptor sp. (strain SB155-2) TaxID=387092 RepID=UPI0001586DCA|nr:hypothetical protein [Nitratiruptor sp. SB155-2]BAF69733.1 hypothetical protein NIS_0619 [Nitratiruptor sp. SB155-2]
MNLLDLLFLSPKDASNTKAVKNTQSSSDPKIDFETVLASMLQDEKSKNYGQILGKKQSQLPLKISIQTVSNTVNNASKANGRKHIQEMQTVDEKSTKNSSFQSEFIPNRQQKVALYTLYKKLSKSIPLEKVIFRKGEHTKPFDKKSVQTFTFVPKKIVEKRQSLPKGLQIPQKNTHTALVLQKAGTKISKNKNNGVNNQKIDKNVTVTKTFSSKSSNEEQNTIQSLEKKSEKQRENFIEYKTNQAPLNQTYTWTPSHRVDNQNGRLKENEIIDKKRDRHVTALHSEKPVSKNAIQSNYFHKNQPSILLSDSNAHSTQQMILPKNEKLQNIHVPSKASKRSESPKENIYFTNPLVKDDEESQKSAQKIKNMLEQLNSLEKEQTPLNNKEISHRSDTKAIDTMKTFDGNIQFPHEKKSQSKHKKSMLTETIQEVFFENEHQSRQKHVHIGNKQHLDVSQIDAQSIKKQLYEANGETKENMFQHREDATAQNQEISVSQNPVIGNERKGDNKRFSFSKQIDVIEKPVEQQTLNTKNDTSHQESEHNANSDSSAKTFVSRSDDQTTLLKESHKQQQFIITLDQTRIKINFHHQSIQMQFVSMTPLMMEDGLQQYIDKVMQQTGFEKYKITLKDKEKRREFSNTAVLPSARSESSLVNVKI